MPQPSQSEKKTVRDLVAHYEANRIVFANFLNSLQGEIHSSPLLAPYIHSLKWRTKDPASLTTKLFQKMKAAKESGRAFDITTKNLFVKINDLAGLRFLHLNTDQLQPIADGLNELFRVESYTLHEKPSARTWDDESRALLTNMGFKILSRPTAPSFYTSVHYVIRPNKIVRYTAEIQVRTLMEEVWGEVDHRINYKHETKILACKEQIAALARATSSCSRLVDSIFRTHTDLSKRLR